MNTSLILIQKEIAQLKNENQFIMQSMERIHKRAENLHKQHAKNHEKLDELIKARELLTENKNPR